MGWEIERRWLVRPRAGLREQLGEGWPLRQGYLEGAEAAAVRIRTGEPRGPVLTCKVGSGVKRREAETVVSEELAELLFVAAGGRVLEKTRYPLGPWELDRFEGDLAGLHLLEIELDHEDDPIPDPPDGVEIVSEVTSHKRLNSMGLANMGPAEQRELAREIYTELGG